jgi:hypothetical protein
MRQKRLPIRFFPLILLAAAAASWAATLEIKAFQDLTGQARPAVYNANGAVTVTCIRAVQSAPVKAGQSRPACYVSGPGVGQQLPIDKSIRTSGAGAVTLTCTGAGQLGCSARINE